MLLEFSHIIAFAALFINSLFDIFSEKGDVPSEFSVAAIIAGILLHIGYAFQLGSITPLTWMIGIGLVFTLYGWMAYWTGMWGGADALAMTVLGFTAPYSVNGVGAVYGFSLFVNIFLVSTVYAALFTLKRALTSTELKKSFKQRLVEKKIWVAGQLGFAGVVSLTQTGLIPRLGTFSGFAALILLYHLTRELENSELSKELAVSEVEVGDVIETDGIDLGGTRERNLVGKVFKKLDQLSNGRISGTSLKVIEEKLGYSEIVGITEEELEELKKQDVENVKIKEGLRLIPVFPVALVLTEAGFTALYYISFL